MSDEDYAKLCQVLIALGPCVPGICRGPDGQLVLGWDRDEHHLEVELFPGKPAEIFYRNRLTNELWGVDF